MPYMHSDRLDISNPSIRKQITVSMYSTFLTNYTGVKNYNGNVIEFSKVHELQNIICGFVKAMKQKNQGKAKLALFWEGLLLTCRKKYRRKNDCTAFPMKPEYSSVAQWKIKVW